MGLDVYLKCSADRDAAIAAEKQCDQHCEQVWDEAGPYDSISETKKDEIRKDIAEFNKLMNCDEWGASNDIRTVEIDSNIHPDHMFKIGYLRSSYNLGGINNVLRRIGCPDLYDIFEPGDDYLVTPNWQECRERAVDAINHLRAYMVSDMAAYDVIRVSGFDPVEDEAAALLVLEKELKTKPAFNGGGWSNRAGDWFLGDGIKIVGAVPGKPSFMGSPTYYLFTKADTPGENLKWYLEALEVTKEMIDYVLAHPDPDNYFLCWSS